jgi:hypothetical protein
MDRPAHSKTDKSFLVLFCKKEQHFFFEKKKQKTFDYGALGRRLGWIPGPPALFGAQWKIAARAAVGPAKLFHMPAIQTV